MSSLPNMTDVSWLFGCFFFQAEDGIRDRTVTGVQTCALPIWLEARQEGRANPGGQSEVDGSHPAAERFVFLGLVPARSSRRSFASLRIWPESFAQDGPIEPAVTRSEERRVGKEYRSSGSPVQ